MLNPSSPKSKNPVILVHASLIKVLIAYVASPSPKPNQLVTVVHTLFPTSLILNDSPSPNVNHPLTVDQASDAS